MPKLCAYRQRLGHFHCNKKPWPAAREIHIDAGWLGKEQPETQYDQQGSRNTFGAALSAGLKEATPDSANERNEQGVSSQEHKDEDGCQHQRLYEKAVVGIHILWVNGQKNE